MNFVPAGKVDTEPFWYVDDTKWLHFFDRVDDLIEYTNAWFLVGYKPNTDAMVIDVIGDWRTSIRRNNIRSVEAYVAGPQNG